MRKFIKIESSTEREWILEFLAVLVKDLKLIGGRIHRGISLWYYEGITYRIAYSKASGNYILSKNRNV